MASQRQRELERRGMDPGMAAVVADAETAHPRDPMSADPTPAGVRTAIADEVARRSGRPGGSVPVAGKNELRSLIRTRRETQNLHFPDTRMQAGRGTLVTGDDGSRSARSPSPAEMGEFAAARDAKGPESRQAIEAEARMYGIDPAQYGTDMVGLRKAVVRERPRMAAIAQDYDSVPSTYRYDERTEQFVPDAYKFVPTEPKQKETDAYKHRVRMENERRNISDRFKDRIGPGEAAKLNAMTDSGDMRALLAHKRGLVRDARDDANRNIADNAKNRQITRNLTSPDLAPGFIYRSTEGIAPHDRAALYTVLGWEPAATRETQAGIAQDAYNSQMAMASQQGGAAGENPDDATIAGQTRRHMSMIARMLDSADDNDINTAVNQATNFHRQANELPLPEAQRRAEEEVSDMLIRRGGIHASTPLARKRIANKASESLEQFVEWAATVGWLPEYAKSEYERLRGRSRPASTASTPAAAGASASDFPARGDM